MARLKAQSLLSRFAYIEGRFIFFLSIQICPYPKGHYGVLKNVKLNKKQVIAGLDSSHNSRQFGKYKKTLLYLILGHITYLLGN